MAFFTILRTVNLCRKKKGLLSLVSIIVTCILIFNLLSPMILAGLHPVLGTVLVCLISTALTMYLVGGFNKKSTSATLGCVLSLLIAGILSFLTVKQLHLQALATKTQCFYLQLIQNLIFVAIIISTMMLATLGAVMDVGMSIASTINEIYEVDNTKTVKRIIHLWNECGKRYYRNNGKYFNFSLSWRFTTFNNACF